MRETKSVCMQAKFGIENALFRLRPRRSGPDHLDRETREAAEKKAAGLCDMGYFEVEIIAKGVEKAG